MEESDTLGKRLSFARASRGFKTAVEACKYFGWTIPSYHQHEADVRIPRDPRKSEYAANFQISLGWLVSGEGISGLEVPLLAKGAAGTQISKRNGSVTADQDSDSLIIELLRSIEGELSSLRAEANERFASIEARFEGLDDLVRKQRRDTAGLLVMAKAVTGDFAEQVAAIEERVRVLEARGR
jgi:hypothetical protein